LLQWPSRGGVQWSASWTWSPRP